MCSNYISVELTDIVASLLSAGAIVALLRVWQPGRAAARRGPGRARPAMAGAAADDAAHEARGPPRDDGNDRDSRGEIFARPTRRT